MADLQRRGHVLSCAILTGIALINDARSEERSVQSPDAGAAAPICEEEASRLRLDVAEALERSLQAQPQLIIAQQEALESQADATAAVAPFMPNVQLTLMNERYVPSTAGGPVVVVGNSVLGGSQTKSAYGSLSLSWNLLNNGRDIAAFHSARAGVRAASAGVDSKLEDTLTSVLQAYAELYEAEIAAHKEAGATVALRSIQARAQERLLNGHGTTQAVGQARTAALESEQSFNRACRGVADKSAALAAAVGIHIPVDRWLWADEPLPLPPAQELTGAAALEDILEHTAAVIAAKDKVDQANSKLQQARRAFGPSLSLSVRKDYLGQDPNSFGRANRSIAPNDYRVGLAIEQPLFPVVAEIAAIDKARAELRRAQAGYDQARLEAETRFRGAVSAQREADASYRAATQSLRSAQDVLASTESLYRAGRTDLDNVQHARIDKEKAEADSHTLASRRTFAAWGALRALHPGRLPGLITGQLHLQSPGGQPQGSD